MDRRGFLQGLFGAGATIVAMEKGTPLIAEPVRLIEPPKIEIIQPPTPLGLPEGMFKMTIEWADRGGIHKTMLFPHNFIANMETDMIDCTTLLSNGREYLPIMLSPGRIRWTIKGESLAGPDGIPQILFGNSNSGRR